MPEVIRNASGRLSLTLKFSFVLLAFSACQTPLPVTKEQGLGAGAGLATAVAAEKVKEAFTPDFKLNVYPSKFCEFRPKHGVQCVLVPCALEAKGKDAIQANCVTLEPVEDFWEREVKVESLDTSGLKMSAILNFCKKYPKKCVHYAGQFHEKTIVLTEGGP